MDIVIFNIKAIDNPLYVSGFCCTPVGLMQRMQRGAFWVHICPAVPTQWATRF